jgi:FkbM family methyltransferase
MAINVAFIREVGPWRWAKRTVVRQFYKRVLHYDHWMQLPTGEWLLLPIADHFASEAFITGGDVDWGSEALMFRLLEGKGALLDVGAHIGYYSLYMLPRVTEVYAFEPDPRVRELLEMNLSGRPNVMVIPWAAGEKPGRARFTMARDSEISHMAKEGDDPGDQITVDVVTLDTFVRKRGLRVEAIKIAVEGHDTDVIAGGLFMIAAQEPLVLTEAQPEARLFGMMRKVGYRVFAFVRNRLTRSKRLVELFADRPVRGETKMLFLVPGRLWGEFERLAAEQNGSADEKE